LEFAILVMENTQRDLAVVNSYLEKLTAPVRHVSVSDIESGADHADLVIVGITAADESAAAAATRDVARVKALCPQAQIILCAPPGEELDKLSIEMQARSFLLKPLDIANFTTLLEKTLAIIRKRKVQELYSKESKKTSRITEIIGRSHTIQRILSLLEKVSKSRDTSVLFLGESGTGKSLFAQAIHEMSDRRSGPFMEINCATLPPNLLESELFGYEPGAFTDAKKEKLGLIEIADGGTLFLDEISEVDIQIQAKLLKFLDAKRFRRLGGGMDISVDVRIVVATNRDLKTAVAERLFREDLYYRLNVVEITIPPLRERSEDIMHIAAYYLSEFKQKFNKPQVKFSEDALRLLAGYRWPGNVRELINMIERAVLLARDNDIRADDLPITRERRRDTAPVFDLDESIRITLPPGGIPLETMEKRLIEETLKHTRGNVLKASRLLKLQRGALRYKLAKYGIDPHSFVKNGERTAAVTS
jgi:two-component system response regulator AtoC